MQIPLREHILSLWKLDCLFDDLENQSELNNTVRLLLLNSKKVTDWDRYTLFILAEIEEDQKNTLTYARHVSKSKDIEDIMAVVFVLYKNQMYGQLYDYVSALKKVPKFKDAVLHETLLKRFFDFFIEKHNAAHILFEFPFNEYEEHTLESYLKNLEANELLLLFYIKRRKNKQAIDLYEAIRLDLKVL